MAKENIPKFYEALARDKALAEKLAAADKAYAETHELPAADADDVAQLAFRREAAKEIVLPLAAELGLPFTTEEMETYEREQINSLQMSDDELEQVAGGFSIHFAWGLGAEVCYTVGAGVAVAKETDTDTKKACFIGGVHASGNTMQDGGSISLCLFGGISFS